LGTWCTEGKDVNYCGTLNLNSLKLGDVFGKVVNHEFCVLQDNVRDEAVVGRLHLQLLLRLSTHDKTLVQLVNGKWLQIL